MLGQSQSIDYFFFDYMTYVHVVTSSVAVFIHLDMHMTCTHLFMYFYKKISLALLVIILLIAPLYFQVEFSTGYLHWVPCKQLVCYDTKYHFW